MLRSSLPRPGTRAAGRAARARGQSLVEFALVVPILMFIAVGVGDLGRIYMTAIGLESAAREAADDGAFMGSAAWDETDAATVAGNRAEMARRACTALAALPGHSEPAGTLNHERCGVVDGSGVLVTPYQTFGVRRPPGISNCADQSGTGSGGIKMNP